MIDTWTGELARCNQRDVVVIIPVLRLYLSPQVREPI